MKATFLRETSLILSALKKELFVERMIIDEYELFTDY